jgi:hypothetical protein
MTTYTANQVAEAIGRRRADLDFIIYSHRLTLASEAPGRLNQRDFFLIDVYAAALAFELIRLSGRRDEVCRGVERFLWWSHLDEQDAIREHRGQPPLTASERIEARRALAAKYAADPGEAGECFKPHELQWPWFMVASFDDGKLRLRALNDDGFWHLGFRGIGSLLVVNMTKLIHEIDAKLAAMMEDA